MAIQLPQGAVCLTSRLLTIARGQVLRSGLLWLTICFHLRRGEMVWSHLMDPVLEPRAGFV